MLLPFSLRTTPTRGRPTVEVNVEEVEYLRSLRFSWTKIAAILGISRRTLYRRLQEWNLPLDINYSVISDTDLDRLVTEVKRDNPTCGEVLTMSNLHIRGIRIQRSRLRASLHRMDPQAICLRQRETVRRRTYSVEAPNSLWHIDGNHKLIRWKLVVHGGIDGKTRTIVFLSCASNNFASTVLHQFQNAVSRFGVPDRVRTDKGGENVRVWQLMIHIHVSPSAVIAGSSTHNVRIERLWRDMYRCVSGHYYELFYTLEEQQLLNPLNDTDLYCLHYVFIPRISKHLLDFSESWNHHSLSSEHNHTPYQLMLLGLRDRPSQAQLSFTSSAAQPLPPHLTTTQHVEVPRSNFNPCSSLLSQLGQNVNPLEECSDFGRGLYITAVRIVGQHLQSVNNCNCELVN